MISVPHTAPVLPSRCLLHPISRPNNNRRRIWIRSSSSLDEQVTKTTTTKTAKRVVLVRHGQSTWNEGGRIQGSSDFSILTKKGENEADISRQMLIDDIFDVCFYRDQREQLKSFGGSRESEMISDYDLRELDLYSFQGLLKQEGKEKFGEAYPQWQEEPANFITDGHYPAIELWSPVGPVYLLIKARLGTEYFRNLLQSNCGVSVLDFTPSSDGGSPHVCLNRLNQTPNSPLSGGSSGGRKASQQIILVCHGQEDNEAAFASTNDQPMNMLGVIQSQKTAELLLDLRVNSIMCSPKPASVETAGVISQLQEAAGCLGVDSVPHYVKTKQMNELDVENVLRKTSKEEAVISSTQPGWLSQLDEEAVSALWNRSGKAWESILDELSDENPEKTMVVVGSPVAHISLIAQCLNLTKECLRLFHLDQGSISVIDFPDGPSRRGVIRCTNYTAHLGRWSVPITRLR